MVGLVRLALRRPYTFIVMALLIMIFGVASAFRTPTDIFPNIDIPVVSVVFSYTGLPPDDMAGRIVTFYERALTTSVNDIEHIESQSIPGYGIIKIFFQPTVNINAALAEVSAMSQTVLKQMPAGVTPPTILSFNASSVPILQLALSSQQLSETILFDQATSFIRPQLASVAGAAIPLPYGGKVRQVQADLNQQALHTYGISANDVVNALSIQNLITPVGTQKIGTFEYTVNLNASPSDIASFNDLPIKTVNGTVIYMRDVADVHDGSPPQTNVVHVDGKNAVLLAVIKAGAVSTLSIISGIKQLLPSVTKTLPSGLNLTAVGDQSVFVTSAVSSVVREAVIAAALTGLMILLFLGNWRSTSDHQHLDSACHPCLADGAFRARRDDQCHDARWTGTRRRHPGRRCDGDDRKHQPASRRRRGDRGINSAWRPGDRRPGLHIADVHLSRLRADVRPQRRRRVSVPSARGSGGVRADCLLHPIVHPRPHVGELSAAWPRA